MVVTYPANRGISHSCQNTVLGKPGVELYKYLGTILDKPAYILFQHRRISQEVEPVNALGEPGSFEVRNELEF